MSKDNFEQSLQNEELKIQELKVEFENALKCKPVEDESKYSTSPLKKYNSRLKSYDEDEDNMMRSKSQLLKKIILVTITGILVTILLFFYLKKKIAENSNKIAVDKDTTIAVNKDNKNTLGDEYSRR